MAPLQRNQIVGSNFSFQNFDFRYFAAAMHDLGLKEIELWGVAPHLELLSATDQQVREVRTVLDGYGISTFCLTPEQVMYPINISSGDMSHRALSIARMKRAIDAAALLGAEYVFLTAGRGYEDENRDVVIERAAASLGELANHAAEAQLKCLLEPLQRRESNILNTSGDLRKMLERVGAENLFVVLDTVAMACAGDSVSTYFELFGDRIRHVQFVDGRPAGHLAWGDGTLPLEAYLSELDEHSYTGRIGFEIFGDGTYALDPLRIFERCLTKMKDAMARGSDHSDN